MSESSLIKIQVLGTAALLKKDSNTPFSCEFCEFSNNTCFVNDLWPAGTEKNFCYRTSLVAVSDRFMFPACNFFKKETREVTFICKFCKIFKNIFWQNTSGWLFLVFICKFWVFQNTSLWRTYEKLLFHLQVADLNHHIQKKLFPKCFSSILYKKK